MALMQYWVNFPEYPWVENHEKTDWFESVAQLFK